MSLIKVYKIDPILLAEMTAVGLAHSAACEKMDAVMRRAVASIELTCGEPGKQLRVRAFTDDGHAIYALFDESEDDEDDEVPAQIRKLIRKQ